MIQDISESPAPEEWQMEHMPQMLQTFPATTMGGTLQAETETAAERRLSGGANTLTQPLLGLEGGGDMVPQQERGDFSTIEQFHPRIEQFQQFLNTYNEQHQKHEMQLQSLNRVTLILGVLLAVLLFVVLVAVITIYVITNGWHHSEDMSIASANDKIGNLDQMFAAKDDFNKLASKVIQFQMDLRRYETSSAAAVTKEHFAKEIAQLKLSIERYGNTDAQSLQQKYDKVLLSMKDFSSKMQVEQATMQMQLKDLKANMQKEEDEIKGSLHSIKTNVLTVSSLLQKDRPVVEWLRSAKHALEAKVSQAVAMAEDASARQQGTCIIKRRSHKCPPNTEEKRLWHWYYPDPYDPWCGGSQGADTPGAAKLTADLADGECVQDDNGHWVNEMKGCCQV